MTTNIKTFIGGFSIDGIKKRYKFEPYYLSEEESSVNNQTLNTDAAFVGTDQGVVFLDISCTINNTSYNDITTFLNTLYSTKKG